MQQKLKKSILNGWFSSIQHTKVKSRVGKLSEQTNITEGNRKRNSQPKKAQGQMDLVQNSTRHSKKT